MKPKKFLFHILMKKNICILLLAFFHTIIHVVVFCVFSFEFIHVLNAIIINNIIYITTRHVSPWDYYYTFIQHIRNWVAPWISSLKKWKWSGKFMMMTMMMKSRNKLTWIDGENWRLKTKICCCEKIIMKV